MKVLISSFGLSMKWPWGEKYFHRMPPVCLDYQYGFSFRPDYPIYLLFDEFIIDSKTIEALKENDSYRKSFNELKEFFKAIEDSGRLKVVDFEEAIKPYSEVIEDSVNYDLGQIDKWVNEFEESSIRWKDFTKLAYDTIKNIEGEIELPSEGRYGLQFYETKSKKKKHLSKEEKFLLYFFKAQAIIYPVDFHFNVVDVIRNWNNKSIYTDSDIYKKRELVAEYLRYTFSNLCLSDIFDAALHDWNDIEPFYQKKLRLSSRPESKGIDDSIQAKKLLKVMFPVFEPESPSKFVKVLNDKRIN